MTETWAAGVERNVRYCLSSKAWFRATQGMQSYLFDLMRGDREACESVDDVLVRLAEIDGWSRGAYGAKIRLAIEAAAFRAMPNRASRVLPNGDACWVSHVSDAIGYRDAGVRYPGTFPLEAARHQDVERLFSAWSALDWDGTLRIETTFDRERKRPVIGKRNWAELARLVATTTSFDRLTSGENAAETVSQLFAHKDASIDDKLTLAGQLANRAKGYAWMANDALAVVVRALSPHLAKANRPLPTSLTRIAAKLQPGGVTAT